MMNLMPNLDEDMDAGENPDTANTVHQKILKLTAQMKKIRNILHNLNQYHG